MDASRPGIPLSTQQAYHTNGYDTRPGENAIIHQASGSGNDHTTALTGPTTSGLRAREGTDLMTGTENTGLPPYSLHQDQNHQSSTHAPQYVETISLPQTGAATSSSSAASNTIIHTNKQVFSGLRFFLPPQVYTEPARYRICHLIISHGGTILHTVHPGEPCEWTVVPHQTDMPVSIRAMPMIFHPVPHSRLTSTENIVHAAITGGPLMEWIVNSGTGPFAPITVQSIGQVWNQPVPIPQLLSAMIPPVDIQHPLPSSGSNGLDQVRRAIAQWDWKGKTIETFQAYYFHAIPDIVDIMKDNLDLLYREFEPIRSRVYGKEHRASQRARKREQTQIRSSTVSRAGSADVVSMQSNSQATSLLSTPQCGDDHGAIPLPVTSPVIEHHAQAGHVGSEMITFGAQQRPKPARTGTSPPPTPEEWHALSTLSIPALLQMHRQTIGELQLTTNKLDNEVERRTAVEHQLRDRQTAYTKASEAQLALIFQLEDAKTGLKKVHAARNRENEHWAKMCGEETRRMEALTKNIIKRGQCGEFGTSTMGESVDEVIRQAEAAMEEARKVLQGHRAVVELALVDETVEHAESSGGVPMEITLQ